MATILLERSLLVAPCQRLQLVSNICNNVVDPVETGSRPQAFDGKGLYSAETAVAYYVGASWKGLANSGMTPDQRAALSPDDEEYRLRVGGSKNQLAGWLVYTVLLWTLKTCMLIFYSRLTDGVNNMRIRIRVGTILLAVTFLATFLTILLGCMPIHRHWQINPDPGSRLPREETTRRQLTRDRLLPACHIETPGGGVDNAQYFDRLLPDVRTIAGEHPSVAESGVNGPMLAGEWSIRESFIAVVVGNLPMLYTLFQQIRQYGSTTLNRSNDKKSYPLGSYKTAMSSRIGGKKSKKFQHPLSMPNDTAMDSDERIVVEPKNSLGNGTAATGGLPGYARGGTPAETAGIRVQTDLHVESSDDLVNGGGRRNDYHRFSDSRV
ncbi:MAG: hypothetical protein Q9182_006293 [Xanthomendoza sp. 2 TL-2023]